MGGANYSSGGAHAPPQPASIPREPSPALYDPAQAALQSGVAFPAALQAGVASGASAPRSSHEAEDGGVPPQQVQEQRHCSQMVDIMALFGPQGRAARPPAFVVLVRGIPGSGKSWLARRLRASEQEQGGQPPRVLSIDAYFMVDTDDGGECYRHDSAAEGATCQPRLFVWVCPYASQNLVGTELEDFDSRVRKPCM